MIKMTNKLFLKFREKQEVLDAEIREKHVISGSTGRRKSQTWNS